MNGHAIPDGFDGTARLFPLPNLVLFPGVVQGLHIFEQRYRQMTADALASDGLIALVLLRPGWEEDYDDTPAIERVACLGRIAWHERLADGRYNLRLRGLARVRIAEEIPADRLYRTARVEPVAESAPAEPAEATALRHVLADAIIPRIADDAARQQVQGLFDGDLALGQLCDVLAYALPLPPEAKQAALAEPDAARRAVALADTFRTRTDRRFPPDFSEN